MQKNKSRPVKVFVLKYSEHHAISSDAGLRSGSEEVRQISREIIISSMNHTFLDSISWWQRLSSK
jgi:hypothetical protein